MPIYEYQCKDCNAFWEAFHRVDTRHSENCPYCDEKAKLLISKTARPVIYDGYDEHLDAYVTGPKHKKQIMKEKNLQEA